MLIFRKLIIGAIGAILNFLLFGAANLCVGQIRLALAKIFLYLIYIFGVVFILDWIDITFGSGLPVIWANSFFIFVYIFVTTVDGYRTFVQTFGNSHPER